MGLQTEVSIIGIYEIGTWTAKKGAATTIEFDATNIYTETKLGRPAKSGAKITPSIQTLKQRAGDSAGVVDSVITEYDAQLSIALLSGTLSNLRMLLGLPADAISGDLSGETPTAETLVVRGAELGTEEFSFYVKTMGPLGPRTLYIPRAKVANLAEINMNREAYLEPGSTFDLYENSAGELMWWKDAVA